MFTKKLIFPAAVLLLLSGCGGSSSSSNSSTNGETNNPDGGDNIDTSGSLSFYGFIGVSDDADNSEVAISGGFTRFSSSVSASAFQTGIGALNDAPDTCELTVSDSTIINEDDDINIEIPNIAVNLVSAGEIIPFSSSTGTFAELERMIVFGITAYSLAGNPSGGVAGPVPTDLSFNIPGDVYPAFSNVAVPNMMPLVTTNPTSNAEITSETEFTWEAEAGSESVISINASGFTQTVVNNLPVFSFASLTCSVVDDGSFALPPASQSELTTSGIDFRFDSMSRTLSRLQQNGNAALVVTRSSDG